MFGLYCDRAARLFSMVQHTGWYGMNFSNMLELKSPWGYGVVILVCGVVILGKIWYFKKKKWLD